VNISSRLIFVLLSSAACVCLAGCFSLKRAPATARYFVLSPVASETGTTTQTNSESTAAIGVAPIKLPAYLAKNSIAVRRGTNEIQYLESALWAERLDQGFLRVFAADLAPQLPNQQVRVTAWRKETVALEIHITVQQFDVDTAGKAVLSASWRILQPGSGKVLNAGEFQGSRLGPRPESNLQATTANLSHLVGELSREVAKGIAAEEGSGRRSGSTAN
jgi:uncharacterized lipoprotein YmbA